MESTTRIDILRWIVRRITLAYFKVLGYNMVVH